MTHPQLRRAALALLLGSVASVVATAGAAPAPGALPAQAAAASELPSVQVRALLPGKAVLQVGDAAPRLLRVGESEQGVRLLATDATGVTVLHAGRKRRLGLSASTAVQPSVVSGQVVPPYIPPSDAARVPGSVTLTADEFGHFSINGRVNGISTAFLVDTGASLVVLTQAQAKAAGYSLDDGRPVRSQTANGVAINYLVTLRSLQIGPWVFKKVEALIAPTMEGEQALLGNNILRRLQMEQRGNQLRLISVAHRH
jgi:aspartyl protease family protein